MLLLWQAGWVADFAAALLIAIVDEAFSDII